MDATPDKNETRPPYPAHGRQSKGVLSPEVRELVFPPLKFGAWTGTAGIIAGVGGAIARDASPLLNGAVSGTQFFVLGSSYWFFRTVAIRSQGGEGDVSPGRKVMASAGAGSAAGAAVGLMRNNRKILPAIAFWGVVGAGGQAIANKIGSNPKAMTDKLGSMLYKLSPLKKMTDQEYVDMMNEKILKVEVDIALIDDRIAELREAAGKTGDAGTQEADSSK
ncbi:hypothetical protein HIM_05882 [Hirsutella minnesotensis 3608]|uniref:Uncharacterized protein n=1 Tax=Hirsutella minnesotensis 3608 TaxID=1043627 RepID=A0A0F7ZP26_9HYPO|nr:hypothetical protein HIM_05882 [Hirsutella minnesotensis 3608]